ARDYVLGCTALRVGAGEVCLITDHRILPLSWTRDAYWQAALLLTGPAPALDVVAAHLRWLWHRCERPGGLWMRSHRPNGAVKDAVLQADQQLYPLLELLDYVRAAGEPPGPAGRWRRRVEELWAALPIGAEGLIRSDENPADDRAELPFPLSSQILLWHVATRLAGCGLVDGAAAARTAAAVERHFTVEGPLGRQWAYEVDARGGHRLYHDANDLPTALAPLLGFCPATDPAWSATMRFALSGYNPAWNPGPWGGLGSLHTPGTWTLGDIQEWVAMGLLGERERSERALERLVAVARPDGLLPEAYDPETGAEPVRRWFAWPGAALGALLTLAT
ncbi:MAG: glycoside hydrolase family 125 protein, partial [Solirubrobacteraceae bacterium]